MPKKLYRTVWEVAGQLALCESDQTTFNRCFAHAFSSCLAQFGEGRERQLGADTRAQFGTVDLAAAKHRAEQAEARALRAIAEADQRHVTGKEPEIDPDPPEDAKAASTPPAPATGNKAGTAAKEPKPKRIACKHCGKRFVIIGGVLMKHLRREHKIDLHALPSDEQEKHYTIEPLPVQQDAGQQAQASKGGGQ